MDDARNTKEERPPIAGSPYAHTYQGIRAIDDVHDTKVLVDGQPLPMTELAKQKSPSGFEWGYGGSGPAALAHALLVYEFGAVVADQISYQDFKWMVIANLDYQGWTLSSTQIRAAVQNLGGPTFAEAMQESPADVVDGFIEMTTIVTRRPEPLC